MIVLRCRHGRNCGAKSSLHPISARNDGIIHRIRRCSARKLLQCAYPRGAKAACTFLAVDSKQYAKNIGKWNCNNLGKTA